MDLASDGSAGRVMLQPGVRAAAILVALVVLVSAETDMAIHSAEACPPNIEAIVPEAALPQGELLITGACFQSVDDQHASTVMLGDQALHVVSVTETKIVARLAPDAKSGQMSIRNESLLSNEVPVEVLKYSLPDDDVAVEAGVVMVQSVPGERFDMHYGLDSAANEPVFGETTDPNLLRWSKVSVAAGEEREAARAFAGSPDVQWAEVVALNQGGTLDVPDDPCYSDPPVVDCPAARGQWGLTRVQASSAWSVTHGTSQTEIAVIDAGVDFGHYDLDAHRGDERDYTNTGLPDTCPNPGHGTHVAGIASAETNNDSLVAGMAWNSSINSYKIFTANGTTCLIPNCDFERQAVNQAVLDGSRVINMSYRGCYYSALLQTTINAAWTNGVTLVAAAGNEGLSISSACSSLLPIWPACYDHVIAVAGTDEFDGRASYSPNPPSNEGVYVDLSAPSTSILSTVTNGGYGLKAGTSMAAPLVAGTAALLASRGFAPCEIEETLKQTAFPTSWALDGAGRLNAGTALNQWPLGRPIVTSLTNVPDNVLLKSEGTSSTVYLIRDGVRYPITPAQMTSMGYTASDVQCTSLPITALPTMPRDGTFLQEHQSPFKWVVYCGDSLANSPAKFIVPENQIQSLLNGGYVHGPAPNTPYTVPQGALSGISQFIPQTCNLSETSTDEYIMCGDDMNYTMVKYRINQGFHSTIPATFIRDALTGSPIHMLWPGALSLYSTRSNLGACPNSDFDWYYDANIAESFWVTQSLVACAVTPVAGDETIDPWFPDTDDNQRVNTLDVIPFGSALNKIAGQTGYNPRVDWSLDGAVTTLDMVIFQSQLNTYCPWLP